MIEPLLNKHIKFIKWSCKRNALSYGIEYDELLSNSLEKIWRMRNHFRFQNGDVGFVAWTSVIIKSVAIDEYRKKNRRGFVLDLEQAHSAFINSVSLGNIDFLEHLTRFASKRFKDFNMLQMVMDGYKLDEVQQKTGIPLGTVKAKISRMRDGIKLFSKTI